MTMKKHSSIFYDPSGFMREADPQASRSKKIHQLNRPNMDNHSAYVDVFAGDHKNRARDFIEKEAEDILHHQPGNLPKDTDSLSSAGNAKDNRRGKSLLESLNDKHHDKASNSKGVNAIKYASEEDRYGEVVAEERLKTPLETFFSENAMKSTQESEDKAVTDASDSHRLLDFSTRNPRMPFLISLSGEENEIKQPSDQISSSKAVSKGAEAMQTSNLDHNSNMGSGSDTLLSMPMPANVTNGRTDTAKDRSIDSVNVLNQNNEPSLGCTESVSSKKSIDECAHNEPPDCNKQEESAQLLCENYQQLASNGLINNSGSRYDVGESSFSTATLDAHSMSIAFPGNVSLRSDSSTTSARSFTFPILQPEWNSSPARLARTSEKRLQKNKSRKPGLFCCGL